MEDDIRRHAPGVSHLGATLSQVFEEPTVHTVPGGGVRHHPAGPPSWGRTRLSIELDRRQALERPHAVVGQLQHRIGSVGAQQQLLLGQLVDIPSKLGDRDVGEQAKRAQLLVPPRGDLVGDTAAQDVDDMADAPALAGPDDRRQDFLGQRQRFVNPLQLLETPVAGVAGVALVLLPEVLHQHTMSATGAGGVPLHVAQQPSGVLGELPASLQHLAPFGEVGARVEQHALGLEPVPAGSTRLLLVVLERARGTSVDDVADVRSVDAHAERHRGDHDVGPLLEKRLLILAPHLVGESRVVGQGPMAQLVEPARHTLDLPAGDAVDDAGLIGMPVQHSANLVLEPRAGPHPVDEIRSVERADQHLGVAQRQLRNDVVTYLAGRRGREGVDGELGKVVAEPSEPPELRPELVSPLADAVGLVDRDEPYTHVWSRARNASPPSPTSRSGVT